MVRLLYKVALFTAAATGATCYTDALNNPWCSSFRIVRAGRAAWAAFCVSLDYKWSLVGLEYDSPFYKTTISKVHLRSALRLRDMCSRNGGLFIKVGQHVGSLEYVFPREYVNTFKLFHSEAPETPLYRMKLVIQEELGRPAEEIFTELSEKPLGAASLAQCHRGVLKDGRVVAVKIQHPDVRKNAYSDMDTMDLLLACVKWMFPSFHFDWLSDETRRNTPMELDFCCEARNQERFSEMFKHLKFIKAPKVYWDLTTSRVLTMEFFEGGKVDNLQYIRENNIPVDEISLKLGQMYSEMIFLRGYIHCDPHPGNVLVKVGDGGKAEIVLLDHGLYSQLTDDFRLTYCRLWWAIINLDQAAIKEHCLALNAGDLYPLLACMITARGWKSIQTGVRHRKMTKAEIQEIRQNIPLYLAEITQLLDSVPRQLVLILKTNDCLRGIEYAIGSNIRRKSYITMSKFCLRAIGEDEVNRAVSWSDRFLCRTRTSLTLFVIRLYESWLWWKTALSL